MKQFNISNDTAVVTSTEITQDSRAILYVSHEYDEEEGPLWQFHSGSGDYSDEKMQLVRLQTILDLDQSITDIADLPIGHAANRVSANAVWTYSKE